MTQKASPTHTPKKQMPRHHISRLAFLLAGLLIAVTSVSLLFVGYVASLASTQQAIENEKRLFQNALEERFRGIVREQLSISSSDETVRNLVLGFEPGFARQSFNTLWGDYRHSKVFLISNSQQVVAESFGDYTHITQRPLSEIPDLAVVVEKVRKLYQKNRVRVPGGFGHKSLNGIDPVEYAEMGFVRLDGRPAVFGAMPIIPDDYGVTLPDGPPTILVSAHYIDDFLLGQLNAQLNFASLTFEQTASTSQSEPYQLAIGQNGSAIGSFRWDHQEVASSIWATVVPVIAVLSTTLAALAFGIAWRIGELTRSLQESEQQNRHLALHDALSGLANRLQFNRVLENAARDLPLKPFAVIHCDLDKFKAVNDTYGHAAGDTVIKTMAQRLTETVGGPGLVCRVGGDEFMIIYRASTERRELGHLCQKMIDRAKVPIDIGNGNVAEIGLSIGIAVAPEDGSEPEVLVAHSDDALYQSKNLGRGRYFFFSDVPGDVFSRDEDQPEFAHVGLRSARK